MKIQNSMQADGVFRDSVLITGRMRKSAHIYIGSAISVAAVTAVDSLIAGIRIGESGLAAIGAAAPLMAISPILHRLLGFGLSKMMIRSIGRGKRKEANRIFGAVLIAVAAAYLLVYVPLLIFERPLLGLFIKDQTLLDGVIRYTRPLFLFAPIFEVFLCLEMAFRIDGRAKLFAQRGIITTIAGIFFDILLVSGLGMGLSGLAWASVIAAMLGYAVSLSHFFSKIRTVSPDFSVVRSPKEFRSYIKKDMRLGASATLDEMLDGFALAAQTAAIGTIAGSGGLAVWAVFKAVRDILISVSNAAAGSTSSFAGLLSVQKDYDGVRYAIKTGIGMALAASLLMFVLIQFFAEPISTLYRIEPALQQLCARCLRIGSYAGPPLAFLTVLSIYLTDVNRIGLANLLAILRKGLVIIAAAISFKLTLTGFFAAYDVAAALAAAVMIVLLVRDRNWFVPARNPALIADYSIRLQPDQIAAMSADAVGKLCGGGYPEVYSMRVALVLEESMNYIAQHNPEKETCADIHMTQHGDGVHILITDDGTAYSPLSGIAEPDPARPGEMETVIILGLAAAADYDRVLGLNQLSLSVALPAEAKEGA
ncbi:MAG: hypothetical protein K6G66_05080 [Oscillospiraceae bacterium]|nr:hypothetical protein [Oscillospiraceae bacterium]